MWSSREDSEEKSPPAEAPAPGPAERKSTTNGDDARPAGLLHEPHELSTSTLSKLEAASDEVEFQQSIWDASLFLFNPVVGRSASLFAFVLLAVNVFLQGSFAFYLIDGLVASATRRRRSAPRISRSLFRLGARTNSRNFAVRVILVRIASMWAFRVLARVGPRGRPPVNKPSLHI